MQAHPDPQTDTSDAGAPPPAPAPAPTRRPKGRGLLLGLLAVPALLCAAGTGLWWGVASEAGTRFVLQQIPGLSTEQVEGTLVGDFSAGRLRYTFPNTAPHGQAADTIEVQGLKWQGLSLAWSHSPRLWGELSLRSLHADQIHLTMGPSTEPSHAPTDLLIPLGVHVKALSVGQLQMPELGDKPLRDLRGRIELSQAQGLRHDIQLDHLGWDLLEASGKASIATTGTLALQAELKLLSAAGLQGLPAWQAQLQAQGPLLQPEIKATLQAQSQQLAAQATVQPFAAWPLQALQLNTRQLDLAALLSGVPHTALSGTATLSTQGPAPAPAQDAKTTNTAAPHAPTFQLAVDLNNAAAGPWDRARLPLRSLALDMSLQPNDPASLLIRTLDLQLGSAQLPGGRVHATGTSASPQGSQLHIALEQLRGAALHSQLQALQLEGKVSISSIQTLRQLSGAQDPQLQLNAQLSGQLSTPPSGPMAGATGPAAPGALAATVNLPPQLPLSLHLQAQLGSKLVKLQNFLLKAGAAELKGSGELALQQAASLRQGWHLSTEASAQAPDLRRLFSGLAGSAWQNQAQALDLRLKAELQSGPSASRPDKPTRAAQATLLQRAPTGTLSIQWLPGSLAGVVVGGQLNYNRVGSALPSAKAELQVGDNHLSGEAHLAADEQLQARLDVQAAQLNQAQALLASFVPQAQLSGAIQGKVQLQVSPETTANPNPSSGSAWAWHTESDLRATQLQWQLAPAGSSNNKAPTTPASPTRLSAAQLQWSLSSGLNSPLSAQLSMAQFKAQGLTLGNTKLQLLGSWAQHELQLNGISELPIPAALIPPGQAPHQQAQGPFNVALQGSLDAAPLKLWQDGGHWRFTKAQGLARPQDLSLGPWLQAQGLAGQLSLGPRAEVQMAELSPGRLTLLGAGFSWQQMAWQGGQRIALDLRLEPLAVAPLLARWQPDFGWGGDLVMSGYAHVSAQPALAVDIALERTRGDLSVTDDGGTQQLKLSDLRVGLIGSPGIWHLTQSLAGSNVGALAGALTARNDDGQEWPNAHSQLEGVLEAQVVNLSTWGAWVPAGWRVGGGIHASASFGGRLGAPEITGQARAQKLSLRNPLMGVDMRDGEMTLTLSGGKAQLETFRVLAGDGELTGAGALQLGAAPRADFQFKANKFAVLRRVDRRLAVNGNVRMQMDASALDIQGGLDVDEGLFDFSRGNAPELGEDVIVRRPDRAAEVVADKSASKRPIKLKLDIDLGKKLRVRGHGIDTLLAGNLALTQAPTGPALNGQIKTVKGTFDAYGQKLGIEKGLITFTGVVNNPHLDVLALRANNLNSTSNDEVRVGVSITGTALAPRIKLYSDPDMQDSAKLSWLLLGRAPDQLESNDSAMLQSAALALLAGDGESMSSKLKKTVGLDELSFDGKGSDIKGTVLRVGKNLSDRWYVGYERGLNTTTGLWQLIYRIAQRFTLRAQSGDDNALDLIWQWKWE